MTTKTFIYDQHQENQDWLKRLDFYKEEIAILGRTSINFWLNGCSFLTNSFFYNNTF